MIQVTEVGCKIITGIEGITWNLWACVCTHVMARLHGFNVGSLSGRAGSELVIYKQ